LKARLGAVLLLLLAAAGWYLFTSLGHILHHEDPLEHADVIFVLSGTRVERVAEAGELYLAGWAPRVLLSRQIVEPAETRLRARGVLVPTETEVQRSVLIQMGVPETAIEALPNEQVATATEIDELKRLAAERNWTRIIVVTSKLHTARTALTLGRHFGGSGTRIITRASRDDPADLDRWWANRADLRFVLFESQKLLAYWVGLAD